MEASSTTNDERMNSSINTESSLPITKEEWLSICNLCRNRVSTKARLLPCLHVICCHCETAGIIDGRLTCCFCSATCFAEEIVDHFLLKYLENGLEIDKCNNCSDDSVAKFKCTDCNDLLCSECGRAHQRVKLTKDHTLIELEAYDNKLGEVKCSIHCGEDLHWFCITCEQRTCRNCQLESHSGHQYKSLEENAAECIKEMKTTSDSISIKITQLDQTSLVIDQKLSELSQCEETSHKELGKAIETVHQALINQGHICYQQLQRITGDKRNLYARLKKYTENTVLMLRQALYFNDIAAECPKKNLLRSASQMISRVNSRFETIRQAMKSDLVQLPLVFKIDLHVDTTSIRNEIAKFGLVSVPKSDVPAGSFHQGLFMSSVSSEQPGQNQQLYNNLAGQWNLRRDSTIGQPSVSFKSQQSICTSASQVSQSQEQIKTRSGAKKGRRSSKQPQQGPSGLPLQQQALQSPQADVLNNIAQTFQTPPSYFQQQQNLHLSQYNQYQQNVPCQPQMMPNEQHSQIIHNNQALHASTQANAFVRQGLITRASPPFMWQARQAGQANNSTNPFYNLTGAIQRPMTTVTQHFAQIGPVVAQQHMPQQFLPVSSVLPNISLRNPIQQQRLVYPSQSNVPTGPPPLQAFAMQRNGAPAGIVLFPSTPNTIRQPVHVSSGYSAGSSGIINIDDDCSIIPNDVARLKVPALAESTPKCGENVATTSGAWPSNNLSSGAAISQAPLFLEPLDERLRSSKNFLPPEHPLIGVQAAIERLPDASPSKATRENTESFSPSNPTKQGARLAKKSIAALVLSQQIKSSSYEKTSQNETNDVIATTASTSTSLKSSVLSEQMATGAKSSVADETEQTQRNMIQSGSSTAPAGNENERRTPGAKDVTTSGFVDQRAKPGDDDWEDFCAVCENGGEMICCEGVGCRRVFHIYDHVPEFERPPEGKFVCRLCTDLEDCKTEEDSLPAHKRHSKGLTLFEQTLCEKILLRLYCHVDSNAFHSPVDASFEEYHRLISEPMDFSTIKSKLAAKSYENVNNFFDDLNKVFINCAIFNKADSLTGAAGIGTAKLYRDFVREICPYFSSFVITSPEQQVAEEDLLPLERKSSAKRKRIASEEDE